MSVYGSTGAPVYYVHTVRARVARPETKMRRVCTGTPLHDEQTGRERVGTAPPLKHTVGSRPPPPPPGPGRLSWRAYLRMVGAGRPLAMHTPTPCAATARSVVTVRSDRVPSGRKSVPSMSTATSRSGAAIGASPSAPAGALARVSAGESARTGMAVAAEVCGPLRWAETETGDAAPAPNRALDRARAEVAFAMPDAPADGTGAGADGTALVVGQRVGMVRPDPRPTEGRNACAGASIRSVKW